MLTFATEHNQVCSFKELISKKRPFCYVNNIKAKNGDDAVYYVLDNKAFKIFLNNDVETETTLHQLQNLDLSIFPKINSIQATSDFIKIEVEQILEKESDDQDKYKCVLDINKHMLYPEGGWDKSPRNMRGSKIIDFHRFKFRSDLYLFPTKKSRNELEFIHQSALRRYKDMGGKWKGSIYQTFKFNNGYTLPGYSSDKKTGDNYHKLPFLYLQKVKKEDVLDLGCNQGWYSQVSSLCGAKSVIGIDLCKEDLMLAKELNEHSNIEFRCEDIVKYIKETKKTFGMTFLLSVLHQIYKNMENSHELLRNISNKTHYFIYETPIKHDLMTLSVEQIKTKLKEYFKSVRHMYSYNDYRGGQRCLFVCHN